MIYWGFVTLIDIASLAVVCGTIDGRFHFYEAVNSFFKDSVTPGKSSRAAHRRWMWRRPIFVNFLDNRDQIANSGRGARIHTLTNPDRYRALTALLLLAPNTPMLFMGQEYAASQPFLYFADNEPELAASVLKGRAEFLKQFPSLASPGMQNQLADSSGVRDMKVARQAILVAQ